MKQQIVGGGTVQTSREVEGDADFATLQGAATRQM